MLTIASRLDVMNRLRRAVAEPQGRRTRYEIADPHLVGALNALVEVTLAVDENTPCLDPACSVPGCCTGSEGVA